MNSSISEPEPNELSRQPVSYNVKRSKKKQSSEKHNQREWEVINNAQEFLKKTLKKMNHKIKYKKTSNCGEKEIDFNYFQEIFNQQKVIKGDNNFTTKEPIKKSWCFFFLFNDDNSEESNFFLKKIFTKFLNSHRGMEYKQKLPKTRRFLNNNPNSNSIPSKNSNSNNTSNISNGQNCNLFQSDLFEIKIGFYGYSSNRKNSFQNEKDEIQYNDYQNYDQGQDFNKFMEHKTEIHFCDFERNQEVILTKLKDFHNNISKKESFQRIDYNEIFQKISNLGWGEDNNLLIHFDNCDQSKIELVNKISKKYSQNFEKKHIVYHFYTNDTHDVRIMNDSNSNIYESNSISNGNFYYSNSISNSDIYDSNSNTNTNSNSMTHTNKNQKINSSGNNGNDNGDDDNDNNMNKNINTNLKNSNHIITHSINQNISADDFFLELLQCSQENKIYKINEKIVSNSPFIANSSLSKSENIFSIDLNDDNLMKSNLNSESNSNRDQDLDPDPSSNSSSKPNTNSSSESKSSSSHDSELESEKSPQEKNKKKNFFHCKDVIILKVDPKNNTSSKLLNNPSKIVLLKKKINFLLEKDEFSFATQRKVYRIITENNHLCIAKFYKRNYPPEHCFELCKQNLIVQYIAKEFAREWRANQVFRSLDFVESYLGIFVHDNKIKIFNMETMLFGKFTKYSNNFFYKLDVKSYTSIFAFSHFTYKKSNFKILITDLQGILHQKDTSYIFTDPCIHTTGFDNSRISNTDMGEIGISSFFTDHICSNTCKLLHLKPTVFQENKINYKDLSNTGINEKPHDFVVCCNSFLCEGICRIDYQQYQKNSVYYCKKCQNISNNNIKNHYNLIINNDVNISMNKKKVRIKKMKKRKKKKGKKKAKERKRERERRRVKSKGKGKRKEKIKGRDNEKKKKRKREKKKKKRKKNNN